MNDLHKLEEAFAELERRADESADHPMPVAAPRSHRGVLVAATVVAVGALATGTAVLASRGDDSGAGQAGGTTHRHSSSSHSSDTLKHKLAQERRSAVAERKAQLARERAAERANKLEKARQQRLQQQQGRLQVPQDTNDLQKEFTRVLGDAATFTVTIRNIQGTGNDRDVFIGGIMTAADGSKGGYDVQIMQTTPGAKATCDDPDTMTCDPSTLPDGSSLAVGHEPLSSGAVLREADLITPEGVELVLHVSNQADPKGAGEVYGPNPPLTMDQVTAVATSPNW